MLACVENWSHQSEISVYISAWIGLLISIKTKQFSKIKCRQRTNLLMKRIDTRLCFKVRDQYKYHKTRVCSQLWPVTIWLLIFVLNFFLCTYVFSDLVTAILWLLTANWIRRWKYSTYLLWAALGWAEDENENRGVSRGTLNQTGDLWNWNQVWNRTGYRALLQELKFYFWPNCINTASFSNVCKTEVSNEHFLKTSCSQKFQNYNITMNIGK